MKNIGLWTLSLLILAGQCQANIYVPDYNRLTNQAVSSDRAKADEAIEQLRSSSGFDAFRQKFSSLDGKSPDAVRRITYASDKIAQQKDSIYSGLFWETSVGNATSRAESENKPILSLRLLGNLTDEFSCANSRFFRIFLYSDPKVSKFLRENYILHWKTVRSVPKITIDYGDGRKLNTTITGNSMHLILDSKGRVVDAMPGLVNAEEFLKWLKAVAPVAKGSASLDDTEFAKVQTQYHEKQLAMLREDAAREMQESSAVFTGGNPVDDTRDVSVLDFETRNRPRFLAARSAPLALSKSVAEAPVLNRMLPDLESISTEPINNDPWVMMALRYMEGSRVTEQAKILALKKLPSSFSEQEANDRLWQFSFFIARDTVRNKYMLKPRIHRKLLENPGHLDMQKLVEWTYAEVFLTPLSDKWMGIDPRQSFWGIDSNSLFTEPLQAKK